MKSTIVFPELEQLEDPQARRLAFGAALRALMPRPSFWLLFLGIPVALAVAGGLALKTLEQFVPLPAAVRGGLIGGVVGGTMFGAFQYAYRNPIRRELRIQLNRRGIPLCVACGYDLRGQTEPRCPECGAPAPPCAPRAPE